MKINDQKMILISLLTTLLGCGKISDYEVQDNAATTIAVSGNAETENPNQNNSPPEPVVERSSTYHFDSRFGSQGSLLLQLDGQTFQPFAILYDSSDRIIIAGKKLNQPAGTPPLLTRWTKEGALDTTFGTQGTTPLTSCRNLGAVMAIDSVGRISVACELYGSTYGLRYLRFMSTGGPDPTFGAAGALTQLNLELPLEGVSSLRVSTLQILNTPTGPKLFASGEASGTESKVWVQRLLESGAPDPQLPNIVLHDIALYNSISVTFDGEDALALRNGSYMIFGSCFYSSNGLRYGACMQRHLADGTPDPLWNNGLPTHYEPTITGGRAQTTLAQDLIEDNEGRVLLVASQVSFNSLTFLTRFTSNGAIDTSFGVFGFISAFSPLVTLMKASRFISPEFILSSGQTSEAGILTPQLLQFKTGNPVGIFESSYPAPLESSFTLISNANQNQDVLVVSESSFRLRKLTLDRQ